MFLTVLHILHYNALKQTVVQYKLFYLKKTKNIDTSIISHIFINKG